MRIGSLLKRPTPPASLGVEASPLPEATEAEARPWAGNAWVVVDFETASTRGTPCQLGAIRFEEGREVDSFETLIFQPANLFDPFNVALHGITPQAVANAPKWPEVRARLIDFAGGAPLIAHNAPFDMGVIRDASDLWEIGWPTLSYACTLTLSRRIWPGQPSYSLLLICSTLGIPVDLDRAHEALADARLAAGLLSHALSDAPADSLEELLDHVGVTLGRIEPDGWFGCHARARAAHDVEVNHDASPESPFYGKNICFTGELAMVRSQAWQLVGAAGGTPQDGVTKKTDFLVCGYQDLWKLAAGESKSHKLRRAEELHAAGQPIELMTERDFYRMLHEAGSPVPASVGSAE
jgi:DNA polymerase-3 subunit epsilon